MKNFRLKKHTIKGVGGFEQEIVVNFSDKTTVLLGVNGSGKTTMLNTIFYSIAEYINFDFSSQSSKDSIRFSLEDDSNDPYTSLNKSQYSITSRFQVLSNTDKVGFIAFDKNARPNLRIEPENAQLARDLVGPELLMTRFFRDEKLINSKDSLISNPMLRTEFDSIIGYKFISSEHLDVKGFTNFLIDQHNIENSYKVEQQKLDATIPEVEYINNTIKRFFEKLYGDESVQIKVARSKYAPAQCLNFIFKGVELEFSQLSSGERYLFALVLELIFRIIDLNPNHLDFSTVPGIVLIDEVEDHLHPRWQLTVIEALEAAFPNVQFIVSTHSPLIASSVKREQLIALSNFEIIPSEELDDIYSDSADEVLKKIMFSDNKITKFEQERKVLSQLFNQQKYDEAEEKLEEVRKLVGSNPRWIRDFERKISFAKS